MAFYGNRFTFTFVCVCILLSMLGVSCVTTAWSILWLLMEERPPAIKVDVNTLNKQPQKSDKAWSSSFRLDADLRTLHC
jgi:hypothetical protein